MKNFILILVAAALLLSPLASFADSIRITEFRDEHGKSTYYSATREMIAKSPVWDMNGNPPLSVGAAISAAKEWVRAKYPSFATSQVSYLSLGKVWQEDYKDKWYYSINVDAVAKVDGIEAQRHFMIIVLMDGTVVDPSDKE